MQDPLMTIYFDGKEYTTPEVGEIVFTQTFIMWGWDFEDCIELAQFLNELYLDVDDTTLERVLHGFEAFSDERKFTGVKDLIKSFKEYPTPQDYVF